MNESDVMRIAEEHNLDILHILFSEESHSLEQVESAIQTKIKIPY